MDVELSKCRWIVFDAVGTLIRPTPSVAVAYHSVARRYGSQFNVDEVGERFHRAFRQSELAIPGHDSQQSRWQSSDAIEVARWRWIVSEVVPDVNDAEKCFAELWDHFSRPSSWSCFDDVQASLSRLRQTGYRMAVASNFDSRLHTVCANHSPLKPISQWFVSSETGYRKPALEFYSTVIAGCGGMASEILMIGDDPEHDVAGPVAAGMQALLLDRKSNEVSPRAIRSLDQLVAPRIALCT